MIYINSKFSINFMPIISGACELYFIYLYFIFSADDF